MTPIALPDGETVPALGQGTWMMGEDPARRESELAALRTGIDLGMTLIDTAEMYGDGASEELVGHAISGRRDAVFLVSKAYPHNASRDRLHRSCEASLRRLATDRIDLYLLHWRGNVALAETVEAMERLREAGKIRHWGVSNLDTDDMEELMAAGGKACATDQILYNPTRRGPEIDLLPWLAGRKIPAMAYSPVEQGRLVDHADLAALARRFGATAPQIVLAWVLRHTGIIAIPKAASVEHVRDNRAAAEITLDDDAVATIDRLFPRPRGKVALEML
ncbi:aldo/keto reductase [Sphingomonas abietis]|uniref:Aldo/keto reductase n=1 Tax=Sphingomonas abietis TaxID=3012344 RepID=A0ABY7NQ81_9SPHN|nr:aldo/keto reductase [Sphingomonas abietis]WBO23695.1 aldo/keto reductase [Sphingomonas abietis]